MLSLIKFICFLFLRINTSNKVTSITNISIFTEISNNNNNLFDFVQYCIIQIMLGCPVVMGTQFIKWNPWLYTYLAIQYIAPQNICPPDICPGWSFVPRTFAPIALYRWEVVSERKMFGGQMSATRAYHRARPYALCTTGGCPQATKAHIKMNARKLYQADGYAVKELLKVASLLYNAVRMKTAGGSGDADNHNHNVSFDISSKVTELLCHSIIHSFNKQSIKQASNQPINQSINQ